MIHMIKMQNQMHFMQEIIFLGMKLSQEDSEVSLKAGLIRDIGEDMSVFLQYAEGYRNPNFDEAYNTYTNLAQMAQSYLIQI